MNDADKIKTALERELDDLQRTRDELRVQLHLAAADARDEFNKLETKWDRIESEIARLGQQAREPIAEIGRAARELTDEVRKGYARIREQLKQR